MKAGRHEQILKLIAEHPVETQDELLTLLRAEGYKATQATISRDIKDLRLVKTLGGDGKYRYVSAEKKPDNSPVGLPSLFGTAVVSIECARNLVVIKTLNGMAQAVCASLDSLNYAGVVGTIAGDDTIFVACRSDDNAVELTQKFKMMI